MRRKAAQGFTLVEVVLGALTLAVVASAILGAYVGQVTLNEHARNLTWATQDANRVVEQIRLENTGPGCTSPDVVPAGVTSWNAWMNTGGGGAPKSLKPDPDLNELIVVTCQNNPSAGAPLYCGDADQVGTGEWAQAAGFNSDYDPLRVTVSVCWRHRNRTIGECAWDGTTLSASDTDGDGVIEAPAMLTTLVTCR